MFIGDKMTNEEAEQLIAEINKITTNPDSPIDAHVMCCFHTGEAIKKIIKRFTKQEFPGFMLNTQCNSQVHIQKRDPDSDILHINVVNEYAYFLPQEFKQFTEACNKIVKWLEKNNEL